MINIIEILVTSYISTRLAQYLPYDTNWAPQDSHTWGHHRKRTSFAQAVQS